MSTTDDRDEAPTPQQWTEEELAEFRRQRFMDPGGGYTIKLPIGLVWKALDDAREEEDWRRVAELLQLLETEYGVDMTLPPPKDTSPPEYGRATTDEEYREYARRQGRER